MTPGPGTARAAAIPPAGSSEQETLSWPLKIILGAAGLIFAGVGGLAFWLMFWTVTGLLDPHFATGWAWVVPACTEGGYMGLAALGYVFERIRKPMWVLRPISFLFAAASLFLNMAAGQGDAVAIAGHAVPVLLFVTIVEICRHAVRKHSRAVTYEGVQWWLMTPRSAINVWRAMRVHQLPYRKALAREDARLYVVSLLRELKGRRWRSRVPRVLRDQVRRSRLPATVVAAVDAAVSAGSDTAWEKAVHDHVTDLLARGRQLHAEVERKSRGTIHGAAGGASGGTESAESGAGHDASDPAGGGSRDGPRSRPRRRITDAELMPAVRKIAAAYARAHQGRDIPVSTLVDKLREEVGMKIARHPRGATMLGRWQAEQAARPRRAVPASGADVLPPQPFLVGAASPDVPDQPRSRHGP